jgi:hypothetical protein
MLVTFLWLPRVAPLLHLHRPENIILLNAASAIFLLIHDRAAAFEPPFRLT